MKRCGVFSVAAADAGLHGQEILILSLSKDEDFQHARFTASPAPL
jgi:hypothetical protein